jgi:hypothetical protein
LSLGRRGADLGHLLDFSCISQQNAADFMALALSSEQLELLHGAADAVPPNWRSRYFAAVLDQLLPNPTPSDRQVLQAIDQARRSFAMGTGPPPHYASPTAAGLNASPRAPRLRAACLLANPSPWAAAKCQARPENAPTPICMARFFRSTVQKDFRRSFSPLPGYTARQ